MGLDEEELAKELQPSREEEEEDTRAAIRETYRSLGGGLPISMDGFRALHESPRAAVQSPDSGALGG